MKKDSYIDLENYVMNNYVNKILKKTKNNEKYVLEQDLASLEISALERNFINHILKKQNIKVKVELMTKADNALLPEVDDDESRLKKFEEYSKNKSLALRNELILTNLRLVRNIARKYSYQMKIDIYELESYGIEGLIYAIENFDVNKGYKFASYACPVIEGYIKSGIPSIMWYEDPCTKGNTYWQFLEAKGIVEKETKMQLDDSFEVFKEVVVKLLEIKKLSLKNEASYQNLVAIQTAKSLEVLEQEKTLIVGTNFENELLKTFLKDDLAKVLELVLEDEKKELLIDRYGLFGIRAKSLNELQEKYNMSHQAIYQWEDRIFKKLKRSPKVKRLRDYLD